MAEKAPAAVIREAYVQGISTRSVDELVKAMGMSGVSKSQVSRLRKEIDGKVKAFLDRPIEGDWPYPWIDATDLKVRRGGRIVSVAVIIAAGVNADGRRELTRRGLRGVKPVISDAHEGIEAAVSKVLNATWQRCRVHFMRTVPGTCGQERSARRLRLHRDRLCPGDTRGRQPAMARRRGPDPSKGSQAGSHPRRRRAGRARLHDLPKEHRAKLHGTNPIERLNGEIERRTDVVGIFPNDDAILCLVGAPLLEQNDEWAVQRARYMTLESVGQLKDDPLVSLPTMAR